MGGEAGSPGGADRAEAPAGRVGSADQPGADVRPLAVDAAAARSSWPAAGGLWCRKGFASSSASSRAADVLVVGAAVCVEIWNPAAWVQYLEGRIAKFRRLFDHLSR